MTIGYILIAHFKKINFSGKSKASVVFPARQLSL